MATPKRNDLGYLGEDFQFRLVNTFLNDRDFFRDLHNIIDQNMFTHPNLRTVVGVMKEYYNKYEVVPSIGVLGLILNEKSRDEITRQQFAELLVNIQKTETDGVDYIRELAEKFFKQQNIVKTANQILRIADNGDVSQYERCVELLNKALNEGTRENYGTDVFDSIEETLSDDYRLTIPTGIGKLDEALEGGIGKGELGMIIGSSGFGKTTLTTSMAAHAATFKCEANHNEGFKVLQIVFEDRIKQIQRKHIGKITGVEARNLSKPEYNDKVKEILDSYEDKDLLKKNLRIVRFPSGEVTAVGIERFVKKLINMGFKPDLMIVDYFECLAHEADPHTSNEYEREGKTMRKFEAMAAAMDMAIWVPSQGNRDSINAELVTMDKSSGSLKKVQIAHIIMSIARTMEDIESNKATIALLKNRAGKSGKVFNNVEFNNGTCRISTDNVDEFDDMISYNRKKKEETQEATKKIFQQIMKR